MKTLLCVLLMAGARLLGQVVNPSGGTGTVNTGTAGQIAYYSSNGTVVSGTNALPAGTTGTPGQTGNTLATNTDVAAAQSASVQIPTHAVTPQSYVILAGGSGSSWPYTVGAYTFTVTSGTWVSAGRYYSATTGQYDQVPCAAYNGARTIIVAYEKDMGNSIAASIAGNQDGPVISFDAGAYFFEASDNHSQQGPAWGASGTWYARSLDRVTGPVIGAIQLPASGNAIASVYGNQPNAVFPISTNLAAISCTGTYGYVGDYRTNPSYSFAGTVMAIETFSTALTNAQLVSEYQKMAYDVNQVDSSLTFTDKTDYSKGAVISAGDSIPEGYGNGGSWNSTSLNQALANIGGDYAYYNVARGGDTTAQQLSEYPTSTRPILRLHNFQARVYSQEAGTNDIYASTANTTIVSNLSSICADAVNDGAQCILHTILPATRNSDTQNTNRLSLNSTITADIIANSINSKILSDWAAEPTMGNSYNTGNTTYWQADGLHPTITGAGLLVAPDQLALHRALNPSQPYWFKVPFIPSAFTSTASTTQTNTLVQLLPGEQVCGVKLAVGTAFSGTSISALAVTIGDSTGTSTQYMSSQSLTTTTKTMTLNPTYVSTNGIVQANFTATGANLSAVSAGAANIEVCIAVIP